MHCGLPAIAFNDGGHPEIVGKGGELFDNAEQIPRLIEKIVDDYEGYRSRISLPTIDEVGRKYFEFCQTAFEDIQKGRKKIKEDKILSPHQNQRLAGITTPSEIIIIRVYCIIERDII